MIALSDDEVYTQAADAITNGQLDIYAAIRAAAPGLDWIGHDRRAALASGSTLAQLGADPTLRPYARYVPWTIELTAADIHACAGCGAPIYWGMRGPKAHPYDVEDGRGTSRSHFETCPDAAQFRAKPSTKRRRNVA